MSHDFLPTQMSSARDAYLVDPEMEFPVSLRFGTIVDCAADLSRPELLNEVIDLLDNPYALAGDLKFLDHLLHRCLAAYLDDDETIFLLGALRRAYHSGKHGLHAEAMITMSIDLAGSIGSLPHRDEQLFHVVQMLEGFQNESVRDRLKSACEGTAVIF